MNIDKKTGYRPGNLMKDLISDNSLLLPAISRFDIAFGFGDDTVQQTCKENDVDITTFLCVCNLLSGYSYDATAISLTSLMGYLERAHSSFLEVTLPKIRHHLIDAINFNVSSEVALLLIRFYDNYVDEVKKHMEYENEVIFRYVQQLLNGEPEENFNIAQYSESHDDTVEKLNELKNIFIYHYKQKNNARLSGALLDIIVCERDLLSHFDVESKLFIPLVEKLEKDKKKNGGTQSIDTGSEKDDAISRTINTLSEREKDIIRCVAQGKVNKEIADELCISVHTVATHRRNISAKLDVHTSAGLTVFAIINHLVDVNEVTPM
ncbi:MAG: helix-turn-helix transcriptional regulator [Bacteroidales bacterium]|nr:helix-turn-helix transcriptional regulator [Bacteroidales bacterium]